MYEVIILTYDPSGLTRSSLLQVESAIRHTLTTCLGGSRPLIAAINNPHGVFLFCMILTVNRYCLPMRQ
jgi:hypothetical protein